MTRPDDGSFVRALVMMSTGLAAVERLVSIVLLAGVFAVMAAQVIARYVFGSPIAWSEEAARLALIWLTFVAAACVMANGRHISVDMVSRPLGRRGRLALECASSLVVIVACVSLVPAGLAFATRLVAIRSAALGVPIGWWYMAAVVGFTLMGLHAAINLLIALRRGRPIWDYDDEQGASRDPGVLT